MLSLTYFYGKNDPDHKNISEHLKAHCQENELVFVDICVDDHPEMESKYKDKTPAICIGPYVLHAPFSDTDLNVATKSALERHIRLTEEKDTNYQKRIKNGVSINNLDKFSFFFSRYYVLVISIIISLFVLIPFLAPVLEKSGHDRSANVIYKVYHVICHQLSFRSFYLYGEQAYYPRELAHINGVITYEAITGRPATDLDFARNNIGNKLMGYKIAVSISTHQQEDQTTSLVLVVCNCSGPYCYRWSVPDSKPVCQLAGVGTDP
jgi:hypothetical protein